MAVSSRPPVDEEHVGVRAQSSQLFRSLTIGVREYVERVRHGCYEWRCALHRVRVYVSASGLPSIKYLEGLLLYQASD
jgi:hypothetical protein